MQEETPEERPLLQVRARRARAVSASSLKPCSFASPPQDVLALAEARLSSASSAGVCRKLSSMGRRVLSIESVSGFQGHFAASARRRPGLGAPAGYFCICAFTDGPQASWEARWQRPGPSVDGNPEDPCADRVLRANGLSRQQVRDRRPNTPWTGSSGVHQNP